MKAVLQFVLTVLSIIKSDIAWLRKNIFRMPPPMWLHLLVFFSVIGWMIACFSIPMKMIATPHPIWVFVFATWIGGPYLLPVLCVWLFLLLQKLYWHVTRHN